MRHIRKNALLALFALSALLPSHALAASRAWSVVPSANVAAQDVNDLASVSAIAANDVWAVGWYRNAAFNYQTLVEHWDGSAWAVVPSPNVGSSWNFLSGVDAVSPTSVWAVGHYFDGSKDRTLIEHWNGTAWSVVSSPNPGRDAASLSDLSVLSATDIWAVGSKGAPGSITTLAEHWNGTKWQVVATPNPSTYENRLDTVLAISATDVWAGGDQGEHATALHWDGTAWSVVPTPALSGDSGIEGFAALAANDVWAVGFQREDTHTLAEHWNGAAWSVVATADPSTSTNNTLTGVTALSPASLWAVGVANDGKFLIERWNGTRWSLAGVSTTNHNLLFDLEVVPATHTLWAVGGVHPANIGGYDKTLVLRNISG